MRLTFAFDAWPDDGVILIFLPILIQSDRFSEDGMELKQKKHPSEASSTEDSAEER